MKLPNWFKILWWLLLTSLLTFFLVCRYQDLVSGKSVPADVVVFLVWVALLLAPVFSEISLWGIKLKQELDDLKESIVSQITDVKTDIRNAVDIRTIVSPQFNIPAPAPDAQLPQLEGRIKAAISDALELNGVKLSQPADPILAPEDTTYLFSARFNIEKELRRITVDRGIALEQGVVIKRMPSVFQLTRYLAEVGLIEPQLASAIREVYSVCSPAIHGEPVSDAKISFVKDVAPTLIAALRSIP